MAVLATSILLVGCNAEPAGTRIFGLNESDRDVIVASSQHHGAPRVLTAHTWGLLFDEPFELPSGEITVYDGECQPESFVATNAGDQYAPYRIEWGHRVPWQVGGPPPFGDPPSTRQSQWRRHTLAGGDLSESELRPSE